MKVITETEIKLEAELNLETGVYKIKPNSYDKWLDLGYWMEATALMADMARGERNMSKEDIADHIRNYVLKAMDGGRTEISDLTKNKS